MKFPTEEKCIIAWHRWHDSERELAANEAGYTVDYKTAYAPEMTPIEQIVFFYLSQCSIDVEPQKQIGKYRVDFFLPGKNKIIIECDGHDFHERTKEQAQKDKERDRDLQSAGYRVYRFTGSEIWKTDGHCVLDSIDVTDI